MPEQIARAMERAMLRVPEPVPPLVLALWQDRLAALARELPFVPGVDPTDEQVERVLRELHQAAADASDVRHARRVIAPQMESDMASGRLWRSFHNSGHTAAFTLTVTGTSTFSSV